MRQWLSDHVSRRGVLIVLGVLVLAFALIQLVPYRVSNPPVKQEPPWDSPRTRQLAVAACFDCHSNETNTPWWQDIAPVSWWLNQHVEDGRKALNFSECTGHGGEAGDAAETIKNGSMPPSYYTWLGLHASADLTSAERQQLTAGLRATLQGAGCGGG
ncbi:MAG: heme-binding domain-containing protein [Acidimicrobiia bacterium]|nr:heme-binding domain-containing protein [Acidimicrobiia bacterium]